MSEAEEVVPCENQEQSSMEIDADQNLKDTETCPHLNQEINTHTHAEGNSAEKQCLKDYFLRTNIYEDAPLKLTFDETLADMEKKVVESLSFMRQAIIKCINPAESNAMWRMYKKWFNYYINFVQELSYGIVLKKFSARFMATMEPITAMLKEEEDAKAEILNLPAPYPLLLLEGPKKHHAKASTSTTLAADQKGITARELVEALKEMNDIMDRRLSQQNEAVRTRLDVQNEEVRTRLDRQDETLRAQDETSSRIEQLLASLVARLPPSNGA
ncbi:hypothetical protein A2U01_0024981 [Trifolium medium]|uniref:Uncharacterized protein n=1 Tax=Trifolium medium TaxID=97028 RepID=A0A392NXH7_9FABA|nr:hypothetical protein [Trifolium medium]